MKLNKKGFMLVEVVIVATVISTVLVFLYISINRMSDAYDTRNRYYDVDAMEAAMELNDSLDNTYESTQYYTQIPSNNRFVRFYNNSSSINNTIEAYYVKSNLVSITQLYDSQNVDNYLKEYINYLRDKINFQSYNYLLIVELKDKNVSDLGLDNVRFYTLKVGDKYED